MPLIVSHMFVFYFGIMADLTPPVALAAFAAAPIAKASPDEDRLCRRRSIALAGFVVPFMAVYEPALMLQNGGPIAAVAGYWVEVAVVFAKALFVIGMSGVAAIGYLKIVTTPLERVLAGVSACLVIADFSYSDPIGIGVGCFVIALNLSRHRRLGHGGPTAAQA